MPYLHVKVRIVNNLLFMPYDQDFNTHMEAEDGNLGFTERNNLFRKNGKAGEDYSDDGTRFFGR